jgi:addiction module RelB/DinJ family antitoxin
MWTIQFMSEFGECNELSLAHLALGLFHQSALFGGEHIVGINHASGFDEYAILLFRERNKIPLLDVQGFEHMPRNDHLAPLAHAANPLWGCCRFYCHTTSDYLTVRKSPGPAPALPPQLISIQFPAARSYSQNFQPLLKADAPIAPHLGLEEFPLKAHPKLKKSVETIFSSLGMSTAEAIRLFLKQVELHRGLPFSVSLPNEQTVAARAEANNPAKRNRSFRELRERI